MPATPPCRDLGNCQRHSQKAEARCQDDHRSHARPFGPEGGRGFFAASAKKSRACWSKEGLSRGWIDDWPSRSDRGDRPEALAKVWEPLQEP
jgi:hypothetical protein